MPENKPKVQEEKPSMLTDGQKQILAAVNRRLTIVGKFRLGDSMPDHFFTGSTGTLNPLQFFQEIKPELRCSADETITISGTIFNRFGLKTPLEAEAESKQHPEISSKAFTLDIDSPFLSKSGDWAGLNDRENGHKIIQKKGGELFKKLLDILDSLLPFCVSNFSRCLLKFGQEYMLDYANNQILAQDGLCLDNHQWYSILLANHPLTVSVIKYLVAYRTDEPTILAGFTSGLREATQGNKEWQGKYIDAISQGLAASKHALRGNEGDPTLQSVKTQAGIQEWFSNYQSSEYRLPGVPAEHREFSHYYRMFLSHSDALHKFLRNGPEHSFLFCWLASKYQEHTSGAQLVKSAETMYKVSVEGQGEKRNPGQSEEELERIAESIYAARPDCSDQTLWQNEIYQKHLNILKRELIYSLRPTRSFTRQQLAKRNCALFTVLSQLCGGTTAQLHRDMAQRRTMYRRFYNILLNTHITEQAGIEVTFYETRLLGACRNEEEKSFIASFVTHVREKEKVHTFKNPREVLVMFAGYSSQEQQFRFLDTLSQQKVQVEQETEELQQVYRGRLDIDVDTNGRYNTSKVGLAGVPIAESPDMHKEDREARQMKMQGNLRQLSNQQTLPINMSVRIPATVTQAQNKKFILKTEEGNEVGTSTLQNGNMSVDTSLDKSQTILNAQKLQLISSDGQNYEVGEEGLSEIHQNLRTIRDNELQNASIETLAGVYPNKLNERHNTIIVRATGNEARQDFLSMLRALLLGEYMLATPQDQINLNTDDVSNILGIMLDMVECLGDRSLGEKLYDNKPIPELNARLAETNLSLYYPVSTHAEMSKILNYHYSVCQSVERVMPYLQEVRELKNFFESVQGLNFEVRFINQTLPEHLDPDNTPWGENLFCNRQALLVYLTGQNGLTNLNNALQSTIRGILPQIQNYPFHLPLFASRDNAFTSNCVPALTVDLPNFDQLSRTRMIQGKTVTLWESNIRGIPILPFCASLLGTGNFGTFFRPLKENEMGLLKIQPRVGQGQQEVQEYFHDLLWEKHYHNILSNLIFVKWVNMALAEKRNNSEQISFQRFGNFLGTIYQSHDETVWQAFEGFQLLQTDMEPQILQGSQWIGVNATGGQAIPIKARYATKYKTTQGEWKTLPEFSAIQWKDFYQGIL